ncbi:MAG TPA: hypothetical protein VN289_06895, partial [Paraburkholderia sp.]|nr:hypothetical protein [Paraburkholderia sp.]
RADAILPSRRSLTKPARTPVSPSRDPLRIHRPVTNVPDNPPDENVYNTARQRYGAWHTLTGIQR